MSKPTLHKLDKDLAVLTALHTQDSKEIKDELKQLRESVTNMRIKVYGVAAAIALLTGSGAAWLIKYL